MPTDALTISNLETLVARLASTEDESGRIHILRVEVDPDQARAVAERLKQEADRARYQDTPLSLRWCHDIVALGKVTEQPVVVALGLMAQAGTLREQGHHRESLALFDEAGELFRAHRDEVGWARAQIGRTVTCRVLGLFDEALERAQEARAILAGAGEDLHVATIDLNLAGLLAHMDRPAEAVAYCEWALAAYRHSGSRYYATHTLSLHAELLWRLGRVHEALEAHGAAREGYTALGATVDAAREAQNIGAVHLSLGHYADAMHLLAVARRDLLAAGALWLAAVAGLSLMECLVRTGRFHDAIETAASLHDQFVRHEDPMFSSQTLVWQALAHAGLHDHDAALDALDRAAGLLPASDNLMTHRTALDISRAQLLLETGRAAEALTLIQNAMPHLDGAGLVIEAAAAKVLLGEALLAEGRLREARAAAGDALASGEREGLHWLMARALHLCGRVEMQQGSSDAREPLAAAIRHLDHVHRRIAWEDRPSFTDTAVGVYMDAVAFALQQQRFAVALRYAERSKASALADHLRARIDVRPRARDAYSQSLLDELAALRERYAWLAVSQGQALTTPGSPGGVRAGPGTHRRIDDPAEVARIERRIATIWRELQANNPAYRGEAAALGLAVGEVNETGDEDEVAQHWVGRVQAALGSSEEAALLEYVGLGRDLALFVLREGTVHAIRLEGANAAAQQIVSLLRLNVERTAGLVAGGGKALRPLAANARGLLQRLYHVLLAPALPWIDGAERLVIVPHGVTHHVPFHALHDGCGYQIEDREIVYAPCATLIEHFAERHRMVRDTREDGGCRALALAYSDGGVLPHVQDEAQAVVAALGGRLLREEEATLGALRACAGDYTVLHLAAHAVFRPDEPLFSSLQLHDGWLSTLDMFELELSCSLATLSACETALGMTGAGDELMGLSRALLYAGAPSLLLSLWKVEDQSTAVFMSTFYKALCRGASKASAVRQAQLSLIRNEVDGKTDFSAPFYWAPFQLIGHPGPL